MSLGPSEIVAGAGLRRLSKLEITPVQAAQNRRKSCFWKLDEIDELRATKERGKSMSLSPKSRKAVSKAQPPKQPATTACSSRRTVKKEEAILAAIQPKKLFRDGEKSAAAATTVKKSARPGRVVASRYNSAASNDGRKRSLPEDEKEEEAKRCEKKRVSLAGKPSRGKKKWEIPSEVVVFRGSVEEEKSPSVAAEAVEENREEVLPRIRTFRWPERSPRDSGPAKRVSELVGRRSVFSSDEEVNGELSVCQVLSFGEEKVEK